MNLLKKLMDLGAAMLMMLVAAAGYNKQEFGTHFGAGREWWVFPKQAMEWDVIQGEVWRLSPALLDKKWIEDYRMSYMTFEDLVEELRPYIEHENTR